MKVYQNKTYLENNQKQNGFSEQRDISGKILNLFKDTDTPAFITPFENTVADNLENFVNTKLSKIHYK